MMRFQKYWIVFLLVSFVSISGCDVQDVELISVENIELNSLQKGRIDGTLHIELRNPNAFKITVKSAEFELFTGNVKLGNAELSKAFKIDGNSTRSYPVQMNGNLSNMLGGGFAGLAGLLSGKKPQLTIKGELKAGNFFYSKKVPVEIQTEMPLNF